MIPVRQDKDAKGLRLLARLEKVGKVVLRLLGIAHILEGREREQSAARVGLAPRDLTRAVKRSNAEGIAGLKDRPIPGRPSKLPPEQDAELKQRVLAGPEDRESGDPEFKVRHIVELIETKWGVRMSAEAVLTKLHTLKLKKLVCRPLHDKADPVARAAFKRALPEKLARIAADRPEAMSTHLDVISHAVLPDNHAAVLIDGAGFHATAKDLVVPSNLTPVTFPAYSHELNPAEEVWQFLKGGVLAHRLYRTVEEIIDRCCVAWRSLIDEPGRIRSLCSYDWLMGKPVPT